MAEISVVRRVGSAVQHAFKGKGKIVACNGNLFLFAEEKCAVAAQDKCICKSVCRYSVAFAYIRHNLAAAVFEKAVIYICQHHKLTFAAGNLRVKVLWHFAE